MHIKEKRSSHPKWKKEGGLEGPTAMASHNEPYGQGWKTYITVIVLVVVCMAVVVATMFTALWNNGSFLPPWVQWDKVSERVDTNGNGEIERVELVNRHLTIIDMNGNHYVTPNDWLISDIAIDDINGDTTPEVIALLWVRGDDDATYRSPLPNVTPGFSEHIYVFDYMNGSIEPRWLSPALSFDAQRISSEDGQLTIYLPNGTSTQWSWRSPGLILQDENNPASTSI